VPYFGGSFLNFVGGRRARERHTAFRWFRLCHRNSANLRGIGGTPNIASAQGDKCGGSVI
jgi:hypothetical protein